MSLFYGGYEGIPTNEWYHTKAPELISAIGWSNSRGIYRAYDTTRQSRRLERLNVITSIFACEDNIFYDKVEELYISRIIAPYEIDICFFAKILGNNR